MSDAARVVKGFGIVVGEEYDSFGRTCRAGSLDHVTFARTEDAADKLAGGRGWYGGKARVVEAYALILADGRTFVLAGPAEATRIG